MTTATIVAPVDRISEVEEHPTYACECGHVLRVSGLGRHRIYFELGNTALDDPVMDRVCPECGRGLPGKSARSHQAVPAGSHV